MCHTEIEYLNVHHKQVDCGSLVWFLTCGSLFEPGFANLPLLVLRLIMPLPEWWPTRRWPPHTPTEKDSQLYHMVKYFKSILIIMKTRRRIVLRVSPLRCRSKSKWCRCRHSALNLRMRMWLLVNIICWFALLLTEKTTLLSTALYWFWTNTWHCSYSRFFSSAIMLTLHCVRWPACASCWSLLGWVTGIAHTI